MSILHKRVSDEGHINEEMTESDPSSPRLKSTNPYPKVMEACYESLGRYISNIKTKNDKEHSVHVSYYFQAISMANLVPLIQHFLTLKEEFIQIKGSTDPIFKKKTEVERVLKRINEFFADDYLKNTYTPNNIYIVLSKKNAQRAFERIMRKDLEYSEQFFKEHPGHKLEFYYERRAELTQPHTKLDTQIMGLMRDYLRSIDLNYIDASKSYFKEKFTLKDLLRRDKINKKFTKISHVKMDTDGGPSYSAELAADYLLHKMDEMNEDVVLLVDDDPLAELHHSSPEYESTLFKIETNEDRTREQDEDISGERVTHRKMSRDEMLGEITKISSGKGGRLLAFICTICCENKIRLKYYHLLTTILARSKAQFESKYITPFDVTMKFGLEALEKLVSHQFVERHISEISNLAIRIEVSKDNIKVNIPDEDGPSAASKSQSLIKESFSERVSSAPPPTIIENIKTSVVNTFEDICNYMRTSKEIVDFTTLGIDKRNFKDALHKILKHVGFA